MDELVVYEGLEQGSPEWLAARAGIPTASEFSRLLAVGRKVKGGGSAPSKDRQTFIRQKALERITGKTEPVFETYATRRGHEVEPIVRLEYELSSPFPVRECGFMRRGSIGYSPDGLVGDEGLIEVKTKSGASGIAAILDDEALEEHGTQCAVGLYVSGRQWCDLLISLSGLKTYKFRIERDEAMMATIEEAGRAFEVEVEVAIRQFEQKFGLSREELRAIGGCW